MRDLQAAEFWPPSEHAAVHRASPQHDVHHMHDLPSGCCGMGLMPSSFACAPLHLKRFCTTTSGLAVTALQPLTRHSDSLIGVADAAQNAAPAPAAGAAVAHGANPVPPPPPLVPGIAPNHANFRYRFDVTGLPGMTIPVRTHILGSTLIALTVLWALNYGIVYGLCETCECCKTVPCA